MKYRLLIAIDCRIRTPRQRMQWTVARQSFDARGIGAPRRRGCDGSSAGDHSHRAGARRAVSQGKSGSCLRGQRRIGAGLRRYGRPGEGGSGASANRSARVSTPRRCGTGSARAGAGAAGERARELPANERTQPPASGRGAAVRSNLGRDARRAGRCGTRPTISSSIAKKKLNDTFIRAPFAGSVQKRIVSLGEHVGEGHAALRTDRDRPDQTARADARALRADGEARHAGRADHRCATRRFYTAK